tara:strand:+ start:13037 stop:13963 length:927 start_codon:yes stop_codon:yes gene_type:complete
MELSFPLDEERIEKLQELAAIGTPLKQMALYFDVDPVYFAQAANDVESKINYYIERGRITAAIDEELAMMRKASSGEVEHSKQLSNIRRDRGWQISKLDIFGGFTSQTALNALQDYIQSGSSIPLNNEEQHYLDSLMIINSMYRKYGRRNTVAFLNKPPFGLKMKRASDLVDEAITLFYTDRKVENKALRNLYAERIDDAALVVHANAVTAQEWEIYTKMQVAAAKLRGLDKDDPEIPDASGFAKPIRHYSLQTIHVGLPEINRNSLAQQIEKLDVPEREKVRLRTEALIENINLEERLHELEEDSKS